MTPLRRHFPSQALCCAWHKAFELFLFSLAALKQLIAYLCALLPSGFSVLGFKPADCQAECNISLKTSLAVLYFRTFLGLSQISFTACCTSSFVTLPKSVPLGEELPQEPVSVLHCRLLPGVVRVAEVELHASQGLCDICMPCELLAPIRK